jgi:hypothetical protein
MECDVQGGCDVNVTWHAAATTPFPPPPITLWPKLHNATLAQVAVCELSVQAARRYCHVDHATLMRPSDPLLQELSHLRTKVEGIVPTASRSGSSQVNYLSPTRLVRIMAPACRHSLVVPAAIGHGMQHRVPAISAKPATRLASLRHQFHGAAGRDVSVEGPVRSQAT